MDKEGVKINLLIAPSINSTDLLFPSEFCKIHPLALEFISGKNLANSQCRQSKTFCKEFAKLTNDPMMLDIVRGYEVLFILPPRQSRLPHLCELTKQASDLVDQEVQDMLRKGAIRVSDPKEDQFLSSLFLVEKKDGGNRPVVNLKELNRNIPYQHFKMEGLFLLKEFC